MAQPMSATGRPEINLSDFGKDMIRYEFHLLLAEWIYSIFDRMMVRLLADFPDLLIESKTTLSKELKHEIRVSESIKGQSAICIDVLHVTKVEIFSSYWWATDGKGTYFLSQWTVMLF